MSGSDRSAWDGRRRWQTLPRRRRRALWTFQRPPRDDVEARAAAGYATFVRSIWGALEWLLAGAAGVVVAAVLASVTSRLDGVSLASGLGWVATWVLVGVPLRRSRAANLADRARPPLA